MWHVFCSYILQAQPQAHIRELDRLQAKAERIFEQPFERASAWSACTGIPEAETTSR